MVDMVSETEIASTFIEGAPPGELDNVVEDIETLSENPSLTSSLEPAFKKYNEEQLATVKLPGSGQSVIVSVFNKLDDGRYYDTQSKISFEFDHVTQKASSVQQYDPESKQSDFIDELAEAFKKHVEEHYSSYSLGIYPIENDTAVAVALVANRYSPQNCWNGRYRSIYTIQLDLPSPTVTGQISVDVHYFEDGNVALKSSKPVSISFPPTSPPTASIVAKKIAAAGTEQQGELFQAFSRISDNAFKSLRRALPITRQKVEWENIHNYRLGQDILGGRSR